MRLARIAVAWSGGLISFFGVLYIVAMVRMLAISDLSGLSPTSLTDARVMYGAFELGPGIFLLASLKRDAWIEPVFALSTIMFAFIPAVRAVGMVFDGAVNSFHLLALVIELATCTLAWIAWRGLRFAR